MVKIKKSDFWKRTHATDEEPFEDFDIKKVQMSLVRAGARGRDVEEIAAMVKPFEGMTTEDISKIVATELEKKDPETAKYYLMMRDYRSGRFK
jgi:2-phosphoglycerate kinase